VARWIEASGSASGLYFAGAFTLPASIAASGIEFEHGDPDYPIWSGCFWALGEVPATPGVAEMKVLKTDSATITLNDLPGVGGITIETTDGKKITMNALMIEITNGTWSIKLTPTSVSINDGALEVT